MSDSPRVDLVNLWPAESLRRELLELNREFLRDSPNPVLKGRDDWPNQQPDRFAEESAQAQRLNAVALALSDPQFAQLMASGQRFNWAILRDGTPRVSLSIVMGEDGPSRISHAILSGDDAPVLAAGEGRAGQYLSNTTGHYKNEDFVILPVKRAFARIGIEFTR